MVGMAVDHQVGPPFVDRLGQQIASKKREDFKPLSGEGFGDRRVVNEDDFLIGPKIDQGLLQPLGQGFGMMNEGLHLRFSEGGAAGPFESPPESLGSRDADRELPALNENAPPFK